MGNAGELHVGSTVEGGERVVIDADDLTTHGVIVGMTGSGKTGLGVVALEEALLAGVPTLIIDPKGDMANMCLRFPDHDPAGFRPWVDEGQAKREGTTADQLAVDTAARWQQGLAGSGVTDEQLRRFAAVPTTVYTPGSAAGVGLDLVGSLAAPAGVEESAVQDEVTDTVSGLLALVGVESDPLTGREHILLSNLLIHAWSQGQSPDLPTLVAQVQQPPLRRLGVMELDTFFPPADRMGLALRLNGMLASPTFAAWAQGVPLDVQSMLFTADGGPRCAVVSLAHLDDAERQFVVTLLLSRTITWMRRQSGTSSLRALIYMDEVFGFVPPVKAPPSKQPILTILKQARAFGVGMVLSTQNPVDLDYKAISNAGTWVIGRLQTERDKDRLLEGMRSASGAVDVDALSTRISGLDKRQFVLHSTKGGQPTVFSTRWAMSYLAGPMTTPQISQLMTQQKAALAAGGPGWMAGGGVAPLPPPPAGEGTPPPPTAAPAGPPTAALAPPAPPTSAGPLAPPAPPTSAAPLAPASAPASPAPQAATGLAADETPLAPAIPDTVVQRVLDPAAGWAGTVGAVPGGTRLTPHIAVRVSLTFDEARAGLTHTEEFEAVLPVNAEPTDMSGLTVVDHDDRDMRTDVPAGAVYVLPEAKVGTKTWWAALERSLKAGLVANRRMVVRHNAPLKLWSRPTEDAAAFAERCRTVADDRADEEAEKVRARIAIKVQRAQQAIDRAEDKAAQLQSDVSAKRSSELVNIGSSILGGFLGGRRSARGVAADVRRAADRRGQTSRVRQRLDIAEDDISEGVQDLQAIEDDLATTMVDIDHRWAQAATEVTEVEVPLEQTDVKVLALTLVWVPTAR